jgi:hypothetical protein
MKWNVLAAGLLAGCLVLVPAMAGDAPDDPVEIESTAKDCAIFAVLARVKLHWTAVAAPEGRFSGVSTEYDEAHAGNAVQNKPDRRYTVKCRWADFDLAEPSPSTSYTRQYNFYRPRYYYLDGDRAQASWDLITFDNKDGTPAHHTIGELCRFVKTDNGWEITSCKSLSFHNPDGTSNQ